MRARGLLVALLVVLVAAWAIVLARPSPPPPVSAALPAVAPPIVREINDLDRASARLAGRNAANAPASAPARNPFEFVVARPKPAKTTPAAALAAVAPAFILPPPLPAVTLVGLVDRDVNGHVVRTAVLSFGGQLHYVEAGERLGSAYEVVAVGQNAVDLLALDSNTPRRLVQR